MALPKIKRDIFTDIEQRQSRRIRAFRDPMTSPLRKAYNFSSFYDTDDDDSGADNDHRRSNPRRFLNSSPIRKTSSTNISRFRNEVLNVSPTKLRKEKREQFILNKRGGLTKMEKDILDKDHQLEQKFLKRIADEDNERQRILLDTFDDHENDNDTAENSNSINSKSAYINDNFNKDNHDNDFYDDDFISDSDDDSFWEEFSNKKPIQENIKNNTIHHEDQDILQQQINELELMENEEIEFLINNFKI
ncbi:uncharacterized protein ASCRUDRAFT_134333 [Ascoidea rubescens DSM 1968]|uniref:Uncharacterized protein n=1 Tax=Ascoidea rubescens DSM 1968 TaxID=1344418 RepID=A0A1D2VL83_9ASCO|nr:hypothetical protein ASCRUDRAFT_134333 [Ascoidea rubescens DSM 1968]ODV62351.1 hypothetical protein ASCRUDRAFT_134333 [Ascoidea rubescens DSM 1968]